METAGGPGLISGRGANRQNLKRWKCTAAFMRGAARARPCEFIAAFSDGSYRRREGMSNPLIVNRQAVNAEGDEACLYEYTTAPRIDHDMILLVCHTITVVDHSQVGQRNVWEAHWKSVNCATLSG
jgi:hypothetical protein